MKPLAAPLRRVLQLALGFGYMVLLIEAIRTAVAWHGGSLEPGPVEILLLACLPLLAWIWWRYLSPFGCTGSACSVRHGLGHVNQQGDAPVVKGQAAQAAQGDAGRE